MTWKKSKIPRKSRRKLVAFHGTYRDFDKFDLNRVEFGVHVGTKEQVEKNRSGPGARMIRIDADVKNPFRMKDAGFWEPENIYGKMHDAGVLKKDEESFWEERTWLSEKASKKEANEFVRKALLDAGFDSIVYLNRYEGLDKRDDAILTHQAVYGDDAEFLADSSEISDAEFIKKFPSARDSYILIDLEKIKSMEPMEATA